MKSCDSSCGSLTSLHCECGEDVIAPEEETLVRVSAAPVHSPLSSSTVEVGLNVNARLQTGAGEILVHVPFYQQ